MHSTSLTQHREHFTCSYIFPRFTPNWLHIFLFFFSFRLFPQVVFGSFPDPAIPGSSPTDTALRVAGAGDTAPQWRSPAARPWRARRSDDPPRAAARWFRWWRGSSSRLHHPERNGLIILILAYAWYILRLEKMICF